MCKSSFSWNELLFFEIEAILTTNKVESTLKGS